MSDLEPLKRLFFFVFLRVRYIAPILLIYKSNVDPKRTVRYSTEPTQRIHCCTNYCIRKLIADIKSRLKSPNALHNTFMAFCILWSSVICTMHALKNKTIVSAALNKIQDLITYRFVFRSLCSGVFTNESCRYSLIFVCSASFSYKSYTIFLFITKKVALKVS